MTISTDGVQVAYSCLTLPEGSKDYRVAIATYDPKTHTETEQWCAAMTLLKSSPPQQVGLGSLGVAFLMSQVSEGGRDIFYYRFSDHSLTNLSNQFNLVWAGSLSGTQVVWSQVAMDYGQRLATISDIAAKGPRYLDPQTAGSQWGVRTDGARVVWVDHRNAPGGPSNYGNSDIYVHDLTTGKTTPVVTHSARQDFPDVSGDWVVWEDYRNNPNPTEPDAYKAKNVDIYARNLATGDELQLTDLPGIEMRPRITSGLVFFRAAAGIFMIDLKTRLGR